MAAEAGAYGLAVGAAIATFFSPCVYALLPAYLGYVAHDAGATPSTRAVVFRGAASAVGAVAAFAVLGVVALVAGSRLQSAFPAMEVAIGVALIVVGTGLIWGRYPRMTVAVPYPSNSFAGFVAFGAGYATAGAGCVAPVFFGVVLAAAAAPTAVGVGVIGIYAGTFAALLVAATLVAAAGIELATERVAPVAARLTQLAGAVMAIAGVVQVAIGLGWTPPLF